MYKVEISSFDYKIEDFDNMQLFCSYVYLKKTFNFMYKQKLRTLSKQEKRAIIYDLSLFETVKKQKYNLLCITPQKWLENWNVFVGITSEMKRRELLENNLDGI